MQIFLAIRRPKPKKWIPNFEFCMSAHGKLSKMQDIIPKFSHYIIGAYFGANENHGWFYNLMSNGQSTADGFEHFVLNSRDYIATRISYKLNLQGPSITALTACSTSLVTIHLACQGIMRRM